jgi:hypothetical protein
LRDQFKVVELERLQQWAVEARYPADLPEINPLEAAEIVAIAEKVVSIIVTYLRLGDERVTISAGA